jgi:hypothetical protein
MHGESVVMVSEDERLAADDVHHTLGIKLIGGVDADRGRPTLRRLQVLFDCRGTLS